MKAGLYWSYATRSLVRGGQRTLLAMFCVAIGVLAIVSLQLVGNSVNEALTSNVRDGNGGDVSVRSDITPFTQSDLAAFTRLQDAGTITAYTAVASSQGALTGADGKIQRFAVRAVDPAKFPLVGAPIFRNPSNGTLQSLLTGDTAVVTQRLREQLKLNIGDRIQTTTSDGRTLDLRIGGIVESTGLFTSAQLLVNQAVYAGIPSSSGLPTEYSIIYATVPGGTDASAATAKTAIEREFPNATVTTTKDALQNQKDQVQLIRYFLQVVGLLALLIGGVGIINTMQVLLRRRQTEIAMLKTAGYRRMDLYLLFGLEAAILGFVGGVVGALAGVGVSVLVRGLVARTFLITLPSTIDPVTVLSGVAIGLVTALIFGLMPIVQAAQVRPISVLRGMSEGGGGTGVLLSIGLSVVLAALFFALALSILGNLFVALGAVVGTGLFLLLLSSIFLVVVILIGRLPVPERLNVPFALLILVALAAGVGLAFLEPSFGALLIAVSLLGAVVVVLPRTWKSVVKMSLRNIGRQRSRAVTTLVALFIGVFSIGLILVLGQNIKDQISSALSTQVKYNSFIIAGTANKSQVDAALQSQLNIGPTSDKLLVNSAAGVIPVSVNGVPSQQLLPPAGSNASSATTLGRPEALAYISSIQGYDLAQGATSKNNIPDVKIAGPTGSRNLTPADAGTNNVLMPDRAMLAPLKLTLGSQIVVAGQYNKKPITLTVVGFYQADLSFGGSIYADSSVTNAVTDGHELYIYQLKLNPATATQQLSQVQQAVPTIQTFSLTELELLINSLLNNLIIMLTAIASLAMIAGIIIIANAVALSMLERRRELGILKSVGYTSRSVLSGVLLENAVIGFTGALLAMLLVAAALLALGRFVFQTALGANTVIVLAIVLATALVCMVVAASVAWGATRVRPLEVLRYE